MTETRDPYTISSDRQAEFDRREGEDPYQWIARQIDMASPFEGTWLYLLRDKDENQRAAWELHQAAVAADQAVLTARWSRLAVLVAVVGTVVNGGLTLAAVLVSL